MRPVLFYVFILIFLGISCKTPKTSAEASENASNSASQIQGIVGEVTEMIGNQMPMVGAPAPAPRPLKATVYIYDSTHISKVKQIGTSPLFSMVSTRLVQKLDTNEAGSLALHFRRAPTPFLY